MSQTEEPAVGRGAQPTRPQCDGEQSSKRKMSPAKGKPKGAPPPREKRRETETIPVGGMKRRRKAGSMQRLRGPRRSIPDEAARSQGFRFPSASATQAQQKVLEKLVLTYLRQDLAFRHQEIAGDDLAKVFRLSERSGFTLLSEVRRMEFSPMAALVVDVLHAMLSGDIAGVLGTRRTRTTEWLFKAVSRYDLTEWHVCRRLCFTDDGECAKPREQSDSFAVFRMLHAAFRMDYREWITRK